ncbi:MAG: hypothetical protein ABI566_09995 [Pseudolysinimonas sp.]
MSSLLRLARSLRSDDRGIALPVVIGMGMVMLVLISTAMSVATSSLVKTNNDEDWNGALAAAYAGVEEYQSRLANDATYQKYGNPAAQFTIDTGAATLVTLPTGANANPAFDIGTAGTWASVISGPDAVGPSIASFRYEIDNSEYQDKGVLHLRSTGRVGDVTRSIVADLKQEGFIDYLYFTNYETQDPSYSGSTTAIDSSTGDTVCARYVYASLTRPAACGQPQFGAFDDFHGPVRSNDGMRICGSTFEGPVLTSSTSTPIYVKPSGCSNADFQVGTGPTFQPTIDMPPTNTEMKKETRNDLTSTDVPRPGCLYTGPTVITLINNGTMNVISPWTKKTNIAATPAGASNPTQCGQPGTATGQLGSPGGATIPVLDLNLVFVQKVPADASADANANTAGFLPNGFTCPAASGSRPAGWTFKNTATNTVVQQYPMTNEVTPTGASSLVHYDCRGGDLYVKGTLKGQTTLAAENFIYVTGDLLYNDKQADMLGLVGQNAILVYNPRSSTNAALLPPLNREIDAALLSVGHTFQVQNFDVTPNRGTLTVFGAIAQKFRGTVATSSGATPVTGYAKDYQYDTRFRNTAPPKFLTPVSTTYGVTQFASVPAAFKPSGATGP